MVYEQMKDAQLEDEIITADFEANELNRQSQGK